MPDTADISRNTKCRCTRQISRNRDYINTEKSKMWKRGERKWII